MKTPEIREYWPLEYYKEAIELLDAVSTIILLSFAKHPTQVKNVIIRNFIARGIVTLKGILSLWEVGDHQDCWVLYRGILDRLFHLADLASKEEFELFNEWSFKRQYEDRNRIRSDKDFKSRLNPSFFEDTAEEKERYKAVSSKQLNWTRPEARSVAKEMGLEFLYKYGYDFASTLVHPMANDGQEDFLRKTKLGREEQYADEIVVINNSILTTTLLIREGLNASSLVWRTILYDFLDYMTKFLNTSSEEYKLTFAKIALLGPNTEWCQAISDQ